MFENVRVPTNIGANKISGNNFMFSINWDMYYFPFILLANLLFLLILSINKITVNKIIMIIYLVQLTKTTIISE